jgi:hypothetical protein
LPAGASVRGRTSAFERIARLPDYRLVDRLLRSRAWVWLIGIMLGGIVAMQVSLLKLNTGISRAITTQQTLEHNNQMLKKQLTELSSAEMIRAKADDLFLVDPAAGDTRYLNSRGIAKDSKRAADRYTPPSPQAKQVTAGNGVLQPDGTAAPVTGVEPETGVVPQPTAVPGTNTEVVATATPASTPEPLPTPVPTATPVVTPVATPPALANEG